MKLAILGSCVLASLIGVASASPFSFTVDLGLSSSAKGLASSDISVDSRKEGSILDVLRDDKRFRRVVQALEENRGLRDDLEKGDRKVTFFAPTDEAWENMEDVIRAVRGDRRRRMSSENTVDAEGKHHRHHRDDDMDDDEDRNRRRRRRPDDIDDKEEDEDRNRRRRRPDDKNRDDEHRPEMEEILRYHIVREEVSHKDLFNGQLLQTELRESKLGDKHQRMRVSEFFGQFYLNMYARVNQRELRANNGVILAIDNVLCPPMEATEMMANVPFAFSTMLVAAGKTGMLDRIEEEKGVTVFAPDNDAWKRLGMQNMVYLFSPHGRKDLKRIVEYHIGKEVVYSTDLMKEKKTRVRTLLRDQELEITSMERREGRGGRGDRDRGDRDDENSNDRRGGRDGRRNRGDDENRDEMPCQWIFTINKGEAKIEEHFGDFLAENGVIQPINSVLMPPEMDLPFAFDI